MTQGHRRNYTTLTDVTALSLHLGGVSYTRSLLGHVFPPVC